MTMELVKQIQHLPANIEDLSKFVLVGREKLTSVRAEIRAIDKLNLAKDVREWSILDHHNSIDYDWRAIGEYLWLIQHGVIPKESKLALGIISGRLINGEVVEQLAVKIAILPDNQMRVLETSVNRDILRAEIAETGTLPFRGKILELSIEAHEVEVPDDLVPEGFRKCKECGKLFEKEGRRVFCSEPCRSRFHARKTMRKKRTASTSIEK